jgi:NADPH:quinone reductase-like Zn-dependent oxidoreductase
MVSKVNCWHGKRNDLPVGSVRRKNGRGSMDSGNMRSARIGAPASLDSIKLAVGDVPIPAADEVLVRIEASSLNFHDFLVVSGIIPQPAGRIPLSDGAGIIEAVGSSVSDFKTGDRVMGLFFPLWLDGPPSPENNAMVSGENVDGFGADYVCVKSNAITPIPAGFSAAEAAAIPCAGVTAWRGLTETADLKAGETLLIQGTGGVSLFALQIAKQLGAIVIATSSSDEKLARLGQMGADHLINYRTTPDWATAARAVTGGRGVDVVLDVGGSETLPQSISACRMGGRVVAVGVLSGAIMTIPLPPLVLNHISVSGLAVGSKWHQLQFVEFLDRTGIRPVISSTFPLEELAAAFLHQASNKHFGKIAVSMS